MGVRRSSASPSDPGTRSTIRGTLTIQEDTDLAAVQFGSASYSVNETAGSVTIGVQLSASVNQTASSAYTLAARTMMSPAHFLQRTVLPARWSASVYTVRQFGQVVLIGMRQDLPGGEFEQEQGGSEIRFYRAGFDLQLNRESACVRARNKRA